MGEKPLQLILKVWREGVYFKPFIVVTWWNSYPYHTLWCRS